MTDRYKMILQALGFSCVNSNWLLLKMDEPEPEAEPEAELELIGTNFFQILSEECLLHIFNSIELDTYRHRELF
eukprot:SAG11_NODE_6565_length_1287_cov_29.418350_2_plen_74_part_00